MTEQPPVPALFAADATVEQLHELAKADYAAAHPKQPDDEAKNQAGIPIDEV